MRERIIKMLAHVEAYIDFEADETNDFENNHLEAVRAECRSLCCEIERYISTADMGATIREGFEVAIVGPPNAGKSTLMNLLANKKVSITSGVPGTTRDLVSTSLTIGGYQLRVTDTAGIRDKSSD